MLFVRELKYGSKGIANFFLKSKVKEKICIVHPKNSHSKLGKLNYKKLYIVGMKYHDMLGNEQWNNVKRVLAEKIPCVYLKHTKVKK